MLSHFFAYCQNSANVQRSRSASLEATKFWQSWHPRSSVPLANISMCYELCILSCYKFKPTLLAALYQWDVVKSKTMDGFVIPRRNWRRFKRSSSPESFSQLHKGVLIVSITITRIALAFCREKQEIYLRKGQRKQLISGGHLFLRDAFFKVCNARVLLEWYVCQSLEVWKMRIS